VVDAAPGQIEFYVPGLLFRSWLVEPAASQKSREDGVVARAPGCRRGRLFRNSSYLRLRRNRAADLLVELLEHAGGFFAARYAEVQPLFLAVEQGLRIVMAIVAALPAILLGHRRHHSLRQRPVFGKLHPLAKRHCGVVPGHAVVNCRRRRRIAHEAGQQPCHVGARQRRYAFFQTEQPRKKSVEPRALLNRKRRRVRKEGRYGWALRNAHAASRSAMALSASIS